MVSLRQDTLLPRVDCQRSLDIVAVYLIREAVEPVVPEQDGKAMARVIVMDQETDSL